MLKIKIFRVLAAALVVAGLVPAAPARATEKLRIGLLPIADTLLLRVADREGYFAREGLTVELIPFQSAVEKDAAAVAGQLDGYFCELISVIIQRAAGLGFTAVASTSHTSPEARFFGLVTAPNSSAQSLGDLKDRSLAVARQSIVDFLADIFLEKAGHPTDFMARRDIRKIPVRLQMLLAGRVEAALFPEPLLSIAEQAGGRVLMDDRGLDMPLALVALADSKATPANVGALRGALARAAEAINRNPAAYVGLLNEARLIPPQLTATFRPPISDLDKVPDRLPSRELYQAYVRYLIKIGALAEPGAGGRPSKAPPPYEEVVWTGETGTGETGTGKAGNYCCAE
jgi:NitT/TauT family transport system substrate-binding protein